MTYCIFSWKSECVTTEKSMDACWISSNFFLFIESRAYFELKKKQNDCNNRCVRFCFPPLVSFFALNLWPSYIFRMVAVRGLYDTNELFSFPYNSQYSLSFLSAFIHSFFLFLVITVFRWNRKKDILRLFFMWFVLDSLTFWV